VFGLGVTRKLVRDDAKKPPARTQGTFAENLPN